MAEVPPGLLGNLEHYIHGGEEGSKWRDLGMIKHYANAFVVKDGKVSFIPLHNSELLAYKKQ